MGRDGRKDGRERLMVGVAIHKEDRDWIYQQIQKEDISIGMLVGDLIHQAIALRTEIKMTHTIERSPELDLPVDVYKLELPLKPEVKIAQEPTPEEELKPVFRFTCRGGHIIP